ncbi:hypothetical protein [Massilia psychrophila]|uniref:hypothetical protein n=1 Tax=Massilia psychrophila TaxID=1603353 RepID=UPI001E2BEE49|nr:hypothetical protein [Massilia psychrophila]
MTNCKIVDLDRGALREKGKPPGSRLLPGGLAVDRRRRVGRSPESRPVQVVVLTNAGLMYNLNLEGTKIMPADL